VPPGSYLARLTVDGQTWTQPFEVVKDPRVSAGDDELRLQFEWLKKVHDTLSRTHDAVLALRDVRTQAQQWASRVEAQPVKDVAQALAERLTSIENELVQDKSEDPRMFPSKLNSRLASLLPLIEYTDAAPTAALRELYVTLAERIDRELERLDRCLAADVPAFNTLCRASGVDAIIDRPRR
jgi:hypothetical protein